MTTQPMAEQVTFRARPLYWWLAGAGCGAALLFAWEMARGEPAPELVFFCAATLLIGLWYARAAATVVRVGKQGLTVAPPLLGTRAVEFRQLAGISQEGRLFDVIVVLYHPVQANGLLDPEIVHSLHLPAVVEQEDLYDLLQERMSP